MEKCFKIMNEEGQTMTPNGSYDEWALIGKHKMMK